MTKRKEETKEYLKDINRKLYIGSKEYFEDNYKIERNFEIIFSNLYFTISTYIVFFIGVIFGQSNYLFSYLIIGWILSGLIIYGFCIYRIRKLKQSLREIK